ncbi:hybrid sensor histidine kinase/response regulator [Duganella levis]|uniref:histidine kinase n=1 Tax=Duganella levis TaxID=2692169 RepID=A0ABW9VT99_9BURK|nr:ATP-binding protein [Duganella levis]MYN24833.1 response regulator [Duganella levis]
METSRTNFAFLNGGSEAGRQIARADWSQHPMGAVSSWTPACRTALSMVLDSGFPSYVLWGPEFFFFYNDAYVPILGSKAALGQGLPLAELWHEIRDEACRIATTAMSGESTFFTDRPFLLERFGPPQLAYFTFSYSPIRDEGGEVVGVLCTIVETTDTVLGMARLRESEDRVQLSLDASGNIGTWSWYPETNATFVDERFARLFQVDAALAQSGTALERFTNMIHPDDRERVLAAIGHSIATGELYEIDYRIPQLSGKVVWVTAKGKLFEEKATGAKRFAGVAVDITEQRNAQQKSMRMAEQLAAAHERQTAFLATLAHELRNPLAPIRTGLELMRIAGANAQTVERLRGMMDRQVNQLTHLIDDLMDISRINNGKVELKLERMDIAEAIAAAAETSLPHIEQARHHLSTRLPAEKLPVHADRTRLIQILSNILTNAAKYTPAGGRIDISAWRDGTDGVVAISDTGIGIPQAALSGVFDMFTQVGSDTARAQGGLGIGLALVRQLLTLHGGTVAAISPGEGLGATFTIRLPLIDGAPASWVTGTRHNRNVGHAVAAQTILVADDNIDAAETLAALLRLQGHLVHVATDGVQASELLHAVTPTIAFLDIGMPGKDGRAVAREARQSQRLARTTLVALTGWGMANDRVLSKIAGFDFHLTKPIAIEDIEQIIKSGSGGEA